jgi:hypothetical protein
VSVLQFIAALVQALAWPTVVLVAVVLFRDKISALLAGSMKRLKVGPIEAEWDRTLSAAEVELEQPGVPPLDSQAAPTDARRELAQLANLAPEAAVMEGYASIERVLRELLADVDDPRALRTGASGLAREAVKLGRVNEETARAIEGLGVLRNLAAHGQAGKVTVDRANDYLALVDAVLYGVRFPLSDLPARDHAAGAYSHR